MTRAFPSDSPQPVRLTKHLEHRRWRARLPAPLTPLVGREHDVAVTCALLRRADTRLVTLSGPVGVGKTRLALAVAADLRNDFTDGVSFADLAAIGDPTHVASALAQFLGRQDAGDRPPLERLQDDLQDRSLLIVLDSFERVAAAAPLVVDLLMACPKLKVLVTSRISLRVGGERELPVSPLPIPDLVRLPPPTELAQCESVALFLQRAAAVQPDFALTAETAPAIAEICVRLDGLPLALELAAARGKLLSSHAILGRLTDRLALLTKGARDAPTRFQTMRAAIAWSYDLLGSDEQSLLRRLAVFSGGFTVEAAAAIAFDGDDDEAAVLDGLESLLDNSLLRRELLSDGQSRFRMLETIRAYALERLEASGEATANRHRHLSWCLAFAEQAERGWLGPDQSLWFSLLDTEQDNLRSALTWAGEQGEAETGLRLAGALWWYWHRRGHVSEGRTRLDTLLALAGPPVSPSVRVKALLGGSELAIAQGEGVRAQAHAEEALALARASGDPHGTARALFSLGFLALVGGDVAEAAAHCTESEGLCQAVGDGWGATGSTWVLARVAHHQGQYARAAKLYDGILAACLAAGDERGAAVVLADVGRLAYDRGELGPAIRSYREAVALHWAGGDRGIGLGTCLAGVAEVMGALGASESTARLFGAVTTLHDRMGIPVEPISRPRYERGLAAVRAALGEAAFAVAWDEGRALPLDDVVAEAQAMLAGAPRSNAISETDPAAFYHLTPRQIEVLRLLAEGRSDREIAEALGVSHRTATTHVARILTRLGLNTRTAAASFAVRHNLI